MFEGRTLLIATKHHKEQVIAPTLEAALRVVCITPQDFDSDQFGTFTGEIERAFDPITTARKKCEWAMEKYQVDLAVASEGSFGPHPEAFMVPANEERLLLLDHKNNLEITTVTLTTKTNFNGAAITNREALTAFAKQALFPSHALILRQSKNNADAVIKGITNWDDLYQHFDDYSSKFGNAYVETDMRAMFNPTRMQVIEQTTQKLLQKIQSHCPQCQTPGFDVTQAIKGLPCAFCGLPTKSVLSLVKTCKVCSHQQTEKYPQGKTTEDPMFCDICNP
jgi:hypothetical protein